MIPSDTLVIAEKFNLAMDIANAVAKPFRGNPRDGYLIADTMTISWASGHLAGLVDAEVYDPKYKKWSLDDLPIAPAVLRKDVIKDRKTGKPNPNAARQLAVLGRLLKSAKSVIHAGDPEREGQLIIDEILERFGFQGDVKRLWLQAQTTSGIRDAYRKMQPNSARANLLAAAKAREDLDWLVGINCTRGYTVLWQGKGHEGMLQAGRLKSAIVGIVEMREAEIEVFVRTAYFAISGTVESTKGAFGATWRRPADAAPPRFNNDGLLLDRSYADAVRTRAEGKTGVVTVADTKSGERTPPPLLFSLSELQKVAGAAFGLSPGATLEAAQNLYNKYKLTTYPRVECQYAPVDLWNEAAQVFDAVRENFGTEWRLGDKANASRRSRAFDDSRLGEHFAILPTTTRARVADLPGPERLVYGEIVRRYMAQFHEDYVYDSTAIEVIVEGERFTTRGIVPVSLGWRTLYPNDADGDGASALPPLVVGDAVRMDEVNIESKVTSPPPRFTSSTLLDAIKNVHLFVQDPAIKKVLKERGLGTSATRGPTIDELIDAHFFEEVKDGRNKVLIPTPKARAYARALPSDLIKPDFTAWLEDKLGEVAEGTLSKSDFDTYGRRFVQRLVAGMKDGSVANAMPMPKDLPAAVVVKRSRGGTKAAAPRKPRAKPASGTPAAPAGKSSSDPSTRTGRPAARPSAAPAPGGSAFALAAPKSTTPAAQPSAAPAARPAKPAGNPFSLKK
ncbi:DNA topoisomerase (plasmid) [Burkholderia aenigmatica]|uniref:DNA topoisomerase n=1 Tax=Burkholderia aenigmatica TaxID=2015348 RepID=UPI003B429F89